jgi:LacI family transcriptional regulator
MKTPSSAAARGRPRKRVLLALSWYDTRIHAGVARYADQAGWHLNAQMAHWPVLPDDWRGDGVITMLPWSWHPERRREYLRKLKRYRAHHVNLTPGPDSRRFPTVDYDPAAVGRLATNHLLERGFRRIAFVGPAWNWVFQEILKGGRETLARRGLAAESVDWPWGKSLAARRQCGKRLLSATPLPLGLVSMKDVIAEDLLELCLEHRLAVPDEVAVVGVDNDPLVIAYTHPSLTSVDWNFEELGYQAAQMLDNLMRGKSAPAAPVIVAPRGLVARASTDTFVAGHKGVRAVVDFIRARFRERIGNAAFCRVSGMSRPGLYAAFRAELGRSATDLLEWHRLRAAERALAETDDKVATIAADCGFRTSYNLWRAFRRTHRLSPEEWRDKTQAGRAD